MSNQRYHQETIQEALLGALRRGDLWMIKTIYLVRRLQLHGENFDWVLAEKDKNKLYQFLEEVQAELENSKKAQDEDFITKERALAEAELSQDFTTAGLNQLWASGVIERLKQPETRRQALVELAEWVKDTCLLFGVNPVTAYQVASIFIGGLEREKGQS